MVNFISNFCWLFTCTILSFTPELTGSYNGHRKKTIKWAVQKTSTIRIDGSTNISHFGCDIAGYYQPDTIVCSEENAAGKLVNLQGILQIDILSFDCHNKMLTSDLRKTLKADEYPRLIIRFLSLEHAPAIQNDKDFLKGWVEIELAGSRRTFEINYSFVKAGASLVELHGNRCFSFVDFNLIPPKKFAGLIKVNDKFSVDFNLVLDPIE